MVLKLEAAFDHRVFLLPSQKKLKKQGLVVIQSFEMQGLVRLCEMKPWTRESILLVVTVCRGSGHPAKDRNFHPNDRGEFSKTLFLPFCGERHAMSRQPVQMGVVPAFEKEIVHLQGDGEPSPEYAGIFVIHERPDEGRA